MDERGIERLRWRSRRGLLELDLVLERFWALAPAITGEEAATLARLLEMPDNDLLDLVMGRSGSPDPAIRAMVEKLKAA